MVENADRLALIARAGKRLTGTRDASPVAGLVIAPVLERAAPPPHPPAEGPAQAAPPAFGFPTPPPVRLNFAQLRHNGMLTPDNMRSSLGYEYRSIKRKLLTSVRTGHEQGIPNNLVMVTSARPAEGKTFTTTNLAIALATERDLKILLIDADVVRPKLGGMFEPNGGDGLTDYLKGKYNDIAALTHKCTDLPNLNVVFSGHPDEHSPELVGSRRMAQLCEEMSKKYANGIVLVDTPPVLASSETINLAGLMHQIIMVVASTQTTRAQLQAAVENVSVCRNISLLLNKAPQWNRVEGDAYYYYGYGSDPVEGQDDQHGHTRS